MRTIWAAGLYRVVSGLWLVQGETGPIQTVALGCIMQGR